jgi:hypothetical protein
MHEDSDSGEPDERGEQDSVENKGAKADQSWTEFMLEKAQCSAPSDGVQQG